MAAEIRPQQRFPEVDRGAWFTLEEAKAHIQSGQVPILKELAATNG